MTLLGSAEDVRQAAVVPTLQGTAALRITHIGKGHSPQQFPNREGATFAAVGTLETGSCRDLQAGAPLGCKSLFLRSGVWGYV